jgi:hypothetical protein
MSLLNIAVNEEGVVKNFDKGVTRDCGNCVSCCIWTEIKEINKPPLTPCHNLKEGAVEGKICQSCSVYKDRPGACKDYFCAWLMGYGEDEDQPNRSGILMDVQITAEHGPILFSRDMWQGASEMSMGKRAIERISEEMNLDVLIADEKSPQIRRIKKLTEIKK